MLEILNVFSNTENLLSLLLVFTVAGVGYFINNKFWPWFVDYKKIQHEMNSRFQEQVLGMIKLSDSRWYEAYRRVDATIDDLKGEIIQTRSLVWALIETSHKEDASEIKTKIVDEMR